MHRVYHAWKPGNQHVYEQSLQTLQTSCFKAHKEQLLNGLLRLYDGVTTTI